MFSILDPAQSFFYSRIFNETNSEVTPMPHLFEPLTVRGVALRNRIGVSPMCQYSYADGLSSDWQFVHLTSRALGGAGLVITEATAVEPRGRITFADAGLWNDAQVEPLTRVARAVRASGAVAGIQLAHAGRKASSARPWEGGAPLPAEHPQGWQVVGPSPIPFDQKSQVPQELSIPEIGEIGAAFAAAAARALTAGFEWLEIHAGHGYLLHNFYSPLSNARSDAYGGSFENRVRFLIETVRAVRAVWPEHLPLTLRISGTEWAEGGWDIPAAVALARLLKVEGVDLIDCSSGGNIATARIPVGPGYQVPISEAVRAGAGIPTATVGLITAPAQADEIIRNGRADLVLLGREMLRNPYWPIQAAIALKQPAPVPPQYLRAY
jgi:2,4-dienoyl-CoA reductase-like NADH-dependent reductase (Old Yellow Enzyme family)